MLLDAVLPRLYRDSAFGRAQLIGKFDADQCYGVDTSGDVGNVT